MIVVTAFGPGLGLVFVGDGEVEVVIGLSGSGEFEIELVQLLVLVGIVVEILEFVGAMEMPGACRLTHSPAAAAAAGRRWMQEHERDDVLRRPARRRLFRRCRRRICRRRCRWRTASAPCGGRSRRGAAGRSGSRTGADPWRGAGRRPSLARRTGRRTAPGISDSLCLVARLLAGRFRGRIRRVRTDAADSKAIVARQECGCGVWGRGARGQACVVSQFRCAERERWAQRKRRHVALPPGTRETVSEQQSRANSPDDWRLRTLGAQNWLSATGA